MIFRRTLFLTRDGGGVGKIVAGQRDFVSTGTSRPTEQ